MLITAVHQYNNFLFRLLTLLFVYLMLITANSYFFFAFSFGLTYHNYISFLNIKYLSIFNKKNIIQRYFLLILDISNFVTLFNYLIVLHTFFPFHVIRSHLRVIIFLSRSGLIKKYLMVLFL